MTPTLSTRPFPIQMKTTFLPLAFLCVLALAIATPAADEPATKVEGDPNRVANTVVLDENGVKNLRIETVEAEETDFEETIFALGRIESHPGKRAVVSSRIPGACIEVKASVGDHRWRAVPTWW